VLHAADINMEARMYLLIQAHEYHKYVELLDQSFRLRKKIFADRLGWDVAVSDDRERDHYDELHPAYLLWCDEDLGQLYGCVRLMPTTGPTLLYDVFRKTFPDVSELIAPGIWEGTRMCIDEDAINRDFPDMRPDRAFCLLLLALCETALAHGIHTMISNYEPHMRRVYQKAGAELDELGRSDGYGRFPVCCGAFEVSHRVLAAMRSKLQVSEPLLLRPAFPSRAPALALLSA
jgi:acyl homoserine lactone synthase